MSTWGQPFHSWLAEFADTEMCGCSVSEGHCSKKILYGDRVNLRPCSNADVCVCNGCLLLKQNQPNKQEFMVIAVYKQ